MAIEAPIYVPRDTGEADLDQWRLRLESSLGACRRRCEMMIRGANVATSDADPGSPAA